MHESPNVFRNLRGERAAPFAGIKRRCQQEPTRATSSIVHEYVRVLFSDEGETWRAVDLSYQPIRAH